MRRAARVSGRGEERPTTSINMIAARQKTGSPGLIRSVRSRVFLTRPRETEVKPASRVPFSSLWLYPSILPERRALEGRLNRLSRSARRECGRLALVLRLLQLFQFTSSSILIALALLARVILARRGGKVLNTGHFQLMRCKPRTRVRSLEASTVASGVSFPLRGGRCVLTVCH